MDNNSTAERAADADVVKGIKVIDIDSHLSEPLDLWTSRATPKYRDRVPQMRMLDGKRVWTIDGNRSMGVGSAASVIYRDGSKAAGIEFRTGRWTRSTRDARATKERLEFMDENGIWAQIVYPNVLGFAGQGRAPMGAPRREPVDADLRLVSTQIYNDAMAEMQAESGERLLPMALLPWWDIDLAVEEAERCHAMGMRGVNINSDPHLHGMQDLSGDYWTPLWELCSDKGLPVNFHIGASDSTMSWYGETPWPSLEPEEKLAVGGTMMFISNAKVILNLITSGLLERFPKLNFVSVESGIGWIPFILETLDYSLAESGARRLDKLSMSPIEYFRRQIYASFWFEGRDASVSIRRVGVDNVMFETDFPHPICLYPRPLEQVRDCLADLTLEERRKVLSTNAARVYNIPLD